MKRPLAKLLDRIMLMMVGAWLSLQYIDLTNAPLGKSLDSAEYGLVLAFWLSYLSVTFLRPANPPKEPSPRRSGSAVVLFTGFAGAYFVGKSAIENKFIWVGVIALATLAIAALVWRFATIHAGEIGEATFKSRPSSTAADVG